MARDGRKNADSAVALALACGATVENAARKAGVSERTVYRRLDDPAFRGRIEQLRIDMVQGAVSMLTAAALESVKTMLELQNGNTPPGVRLGAARAIMELGVKMREALELEKRLQALEEQMLRVEESKKAIPEPRSGD